jgi:hypothetical protein
MKQFITIMLIAVVFISSSCEKGIFGKKDSPAAAPAPEAKYYGIWNATQIAQDLNSNNKIDANEYFNINGSSSLNLNNDKKFTYVLTTPSGTSNMSGNWTAAADLKTFTITDAAQGSIRFDYRTDTEFQTEPIPVTGGVAWLIYKKQ